MINSEVLNTSRIISIKMEKVAISVGLILVYFVYKVMQRQKLDAVAEFET